MKRLASCLLLLLGAVLVGCPGGDTNGNGRPEDGGNLGDCDEGLVPCGDEGECVDTSSDPQNCGGCGHACEAEEPFCFHGECEEDCSPLATCGDECVSLADPEHCGSCDRVCTDEAPYCEGGQCVARCVSGEAPCPGGACPDIQTDPSNCGGCDIACDVGQHCESASCVNDDVVCPGQILCDGRCVDDGACVCTEAEDTDCDPSPNATNCRNLQSSDSNCGDCGLSCGDGMDCVDSFCVPECTCGEGQVCVEDVCFDGAPVESCDACPAQDDPPQICCESDDQVFCIADFACPADE